VSYCVRSASFARFGLPLALILGFPAVTQGQTDRARVSEKIGLTQKLGVKVPMDLPFRDEAGREVTLGQYFQGERPVVLTLVFFGCKGSCLMIRDGLLKVLNSQKKLHAGRDFDVIVASIHPKETPQLAAEAKKFWTENYKVQGTEGAWHFLTGDMPAIQSLTQAVGFKFDYDPKTDVIVHPATLVLLTPDGTASYFMQGAVYSAKEFHDAMLKAARSEVGQTSPVVRWPACLAYDPATGKYRVIVENVLVWLGLLTVAFLFGSIGYMAFKHRREPLFKIPGSGQGGETGA